MINVTPKLPIIGMKSDGGMLRGSLTALSATRARVEWLNSENAPSSNQIKQIKFFDASLSSSEISIAHEADGLLEFKQESLPAIQDLLHLLRKTQHLEICATQDIERFDKNNGFSAVTLPVVALPERSYDDIKTDSPFLGRAFSAPILITGMTGGVQQGTSINERLARAATDHNIPMGVGSQRVALENPEHADIFRMKHKFPKLFLIANIGIGQLRKPNFLDLCKHAVDMIQADALAIHVNVLQELIQVEGDRDFRGIIEKIGVIKSKTSVPIIVKEVGAGLDVSSAKRLAEVGIDCFDVGGSGGTSWAMIEGLRANDPLVRRRGEIFRNWGIPTALALAALRKELPNSTLVATGGIRDGLTVLKAVHTGANMAGIGLPLMRAAIEGPEEPSKLLGAIIEELKIAKMISGL